MDYVALRNPFLDPQLAEYRQGVQLLTTPRVSFFMIGDQSHIGFKSLDLTGLQEINLYVDVSSRASAIGGSVEVRSDSPTGKVIGESAEVTAKEGPGRPPQGVDPTAWRRANSNKAQVKLSPVTGIHDVYFIFKNPNAKGEEVLMSINEIEFMNRPTPPAVVN